jgi:hypothetical protein
MDPSTPEPSNGLDSRWPMRILAICAVGALATGIAGLHQHGFGLVSAAYQTLQMFFMNSPNVPEPMPWLVEIARWLAATSTLATLFRLGGSLFQEERSSLRLRRMKDHTVLAGLGHRAMQIVEYLRDSGEEVVVVDKAPPQDLARECRRTGAHVLVGDATDEDVLCAAGIERAHRVFVLCPSDSTNCEVAAQIRRLRTSASSGGPESPLQCHVHLSDVDLRSSLQPVFARHAGGVTLRFFDLFDFEARRLLSEDLPLDGRGVTEKDGRSAHLIILGLGRMGRALAVRAAQVGHFANGRRLKISAIDRRAADQEAALLFRYPRFREVCDLEAHSIEAETPQARHLLEQWCCEPSTIRSVAICFDNEPRALEIALQLQQMLQGCPVPIAIRMARQSGLARLLRGQDATQTRGPLAAIRPFGVYEDSCHPESLVEGVEDRPARRLHADSVQRHSQQGETAATNPAIRDWDDLDEDLRESYRQQAAHLFIKLRAVGCEAADQDDLRPAATGFQPAQVEALARMEHSRWAAEQILAGWTQAPGLKDVMRKTTPHLVPWDKLPPDLQQYDRDLVLLIPALLASDGKKICRQR